MNTEVYRNEWKWVQDVVDAGFAYGPDRAITGLPAAPVDYVKVRISDPSQNEIAVAASTHGYEIGDLMITIWSDTLRETPSDPESVAITPFNGDKITVDGVTWVLKSVATAVYGWQFVCMARRSAFTAR